MSQPIRRTLLLISLAFVAGHAGCGQSSSSDMRAARESNTSQRRRPVWENIDAYSPPGSLAATKPGTPASAALVTPAPVPGPVLAVPQSTPAPAPVAQQAAPPASAAPTSALQSQVSAGGVPASQTPATSAEQASTTVSDKPADGQEFRPPFAERTNVFAPPGAGAREAAAGDGAVASPVAADVSLKGFARVHDLRAILMIADTIAPLALGQEKFGVRVVSIEPPRVTLARAEQEWTLSLTNRIANENDESASPTGRRPE